MNEATAHGAAAAEAEAHSRDVVAAARQCAAVAAAMTTAESGGSSTAASTSTSMGNASPGLDVWVVPLRDVFLLGDAEALRREAVRSWRQQQQQQQQPAADGTPVWGGEAGGDSDYVGEAAATASGAAEREARLQQLLQVCMGCMRPSRGTARWVRPGSLQTRGPTKLVVCICLQQGGGVVGAF